MDIFDLFATSALLEESGKDFDFGGGVKFRIARIGNSRYQRTLTQLFEANRETLEMKGSDEALAAADECSRNIMRQVYARTILLGWSGPVKYKGKPAEYSWEDAEMLLQHKDFFAWVDARAKNYQNYLLSSQEEDAKNSETTSPGTSSGEVASSSS